MIEFVSEEDKGKEGEEASDTHATCRFYHKNSMDFRKGECRIFPPVLFAVQMKGPMNSIRVQVDSAYPPLRGDGPACNEHKPRLEVVSV